MHALLLWFISTMFMILLSPGWVILRLLICMPLKCHECCYKRPVWLALMLVFGACNTMQDFQYLLVGHSVDIFAKCMSNITQCISTNAQCISHSASALRQFECYGICPTRRTVGL